jgi:glycosyltransferase involved in cell wall biosynthesis
VAVQEYIPAIDKFRTLPFWPEKVNYRYGLPLFLLWQGIKVATRIPDVVRTWSHQVIWLERELLPGWVTLEPLLKRPVVFDIDDAVWLAPPFGTSVKKIARRSEVVVAGNNYLADWFASSCRDVRVVPTAVDLDRYRPGPDDSPGKNSRFRIGWIGSSANLRYLEAIESPLDRFLADHRDSELFVMADKPPAFRHLPGDRIRFLPWSENAEVGAFQQLDVGLMPLPNEEWTRGKCSYKMLQYMACGIPVTVSPVGMNVEILALGRAGLTCSENGEWYEALSDLYANRERARAYGIEGRKIVERYFSRKQVTGTLAGIFRELA